MSKASACYKVKSNMMHKFYSEPVAALDLRLTKSEASLFGMESNPLDVDVKMDEEELDIEQGEGGWGLDTKEEIRIPVDCPEVPVSNLPPLSPLSPLSSPIPLPQPPAEVAEHEEDIDPSPGDIQHVTLHIARSPPQSVGVPASTSTAAAAGGGAWSQTQVERISSSSSSLSTSPHHHHPSSTGLAHRHSVIEEWRGLGVNPSNLWLFPRHGTPTNQPVRDRRDTGDTSCLLAEKQWSLPENPLSCRPFLQECIKSSTSSDSSSYPIPAASYSTNLSSHSPPLLPKFTPLPPSYYTPVDGFQPSPKSLRPEYLPRQHHSPLPNPTNHPPRYFAHTDLLAPRGSVIVHQPPLFQHDTEKSSKCHSGAAKGHPIHPSPLENLGVGPHPIKQEDLSQPYHRAEDEFKQELEDLKSPQWLSKIQQLRTDFAFQMLEARRRQGCEGQELPYYPPTLQFLSQLSAPRDPCSSGSLPPGGQIKANPGAKGTLDLVNTFLQHMDHPSRGRSPQENLLSSTTSPGLPPPTSLPSSNRLGKRGRPRKHAPKVTMHP